MSATATKSENKNVQVTLERSPGCRIKLNVVISPEVAQTTYAEALKSVGKTISIPKSKKNSTPEHYIMEHHEAEVQAEWRKILLQTVFQEAFSLGNASPLENENVKCDEIDNISPKTGGSLSFEYVTHPLTPVINLSDITLQNVNRRAVTKKEIDVALDKISINFATWTDVTNCPVEEGDFVILDICKADEPWNEICRNTLFQVKTGKMANWMRKSLLGKKINEFVKEISEPDYNQPELNEASFEPIEYIITIRAIKTASLPEITDDLARKAGASNLIHLKEIITADLNRLADNEVAEKLRQQVDTTLLSRFHFELPYTIVKKEKDARLHNAVALLEKQQSSQDTKKEQLAKLEKLIDAEIDRNLRLYFLLQTFARQHNIQVNSEEVARELTQLIMQNTLNLQSYQNNEDLKNKLTMQLLLIKARDYIIQHVGRQ